MPPRRSTRKRKSDQQEEKEEKHVPAKASKKDSETESKKPTEDDDEGKDEESLVLKPDTECKFQPFDVTQDTPIKQFAEEMGFALDRRGYYEWTKPEQVSPTPLSLTHNRTTRAPPTSPFLLSLLAQHHISSARVPVCRGCDCWLHQISATKKIVVMSKSPIQFYEGPAARRLAGLSSNKKTQKAEPPELKDYKVFIQSTSVSRRLEKGTQFVLELTSFENCGP